MAEVKYLDKTGLTSVWSKVKGIVTPKADKVSGATAGHLAGLNSGGNLVDSGLAADNIAQKDGSYSGMTVGAAEDLVSAESVASEFTSRITGGSTAVGKGGTALLDRIKGRTLVWNQLENGTWTSAFNLVKDGNTYTLSANAERDTLTMSYNKSFITGHKYFVKAHLKLNREASLSGSFYPGYFATPTQWVSYGITGESLRAGFDLKEIITLATDKTTLYLGAYHVGTTDKFATTDTLVISNPQVYDLTLMFGAGNEPSTVAEFEALYPGPYYDYNPGTLISNAATAIETVGWNIWDEEWEVGMINPTDGTNASSNTQIRSSYIPVFGGADYFFPTKTYIVCTYDANKKFLSRIKYSTAGVTRTLDNNAAYLRFCTYTDYGTTYKNDICISLPDPSRNGTYEPYWRSELELGLGDIKVKSHNLWDEEWEAGNINSTTGENAGSTTLIRSVNYIKVEPGKTYYAGTTGDFYYRFYDNNKNYIPFSSSFVQDANRARTVFTMPEGVGYIRFIHTGTTYTNDICLNLSDPAFNGRYEPYGDGGVISITGGLKSAGTVYDEIVGNKAIKRIGAVDMGTMVWSTTTQDRIYSASLASVIKKTGGDTEYANSVCPRYLVGTAAGAYAHTFDKLISVNAAGNVIVYDSAFAGMSTSAITLALSSVTLYYELATPIEYELAEAIPTAMRNDPYGTERRLPEDTAAIVTAPFRADITYSTNIKEAVQSLPQNYININSMQDFLAALGTLMGGTWTMRQADGKFDFTFTPNPSNE